MQVVAGDAVMSMDSDEFLHRSDASTAPPDGCNLRLEPVPSPRIPNSYDRIAQHALRTTALEREELAMVPALMSRAAVRVPEALGKQVLTVEDVLAAPSVGAVTTQFECARRADGAAAVIVVRATATGANHRPGVGIVGGGQGSGPTWPPPAEHLSENIFSARHAATMAYMEAGGLQASDIDFFGLYDCFPVC
eukprot:SAG31_NODE_199_length_20573_cov_5.832129_8_plen_193_part_00